MRPAIKSARKTGVNYGLMMSTLRHALYTRITLQSLVQTEYSYTIVFLKICSLLLNFCSVIISVILKKVGYGLVKHKW